MHTADVLAPLTDAYQPSAHVTQAAAPVVRSLYEPGMQMVHIADVGAAALEP